MGERGQELIFTAIGVAKARLAFDESLGCEHSVRDVGALDEYSRHRACLIEDGLIDEIEIP